MVQAGQNSRPVRRESHRENAQPPLTIDSNAVENLIRPIALTRKNALSAGHDEGGRTWGRIASLIATAKINESNPLSISRRRSKRSRQGIPRTGSTGCDPGTSSRRAELRSGVDAAYQAVVLNSGRA